MLRTGNWLNLNSLSWEKRASPVYNPLTTYPNKMWSFRGRPTIFGYPRCDEAGVCRDTEVLQYDPEADEWVDLGDLRQPREYAELVEVPGEVCDLIDVRTTTTVSTTSTTSFTTTAETTSFTTVTAPTTTEDPAADEVAIILVLSKKRISGFCKIPHDERIPTQQQNKRPCLHSFGIFS